jgi:predicted ester cyclase
VRATWSPRARRSGATHLGELWDLPPTGNRVEFEFIDILRVADGKLIEHWTSMDLAALRSQMRPRS